VYPFREQEDEMAVAIRQSIFREYDIRGIVGKDIDESVAEKIGKAFGTFLRRDGKSSCVTGRDNRTSSESLQRAVNNGLTSAGICVIEVGMVITPMVYYAQKAWDLDGSVMITASHNPPDYNGFKMTCGPGSIYGDDILSLHHLIESGGFEAGDGSVESREIAADYSQMICDKVKLGPQKLKAVFDAGNGTSSPFVPPILEGLGVEVLPLFCVSDPTFPNHHPDPTKIDNVQDMIPLVAENDADLGIGLDGDGDRIGVVDEQGNIVWGDRLMILFAQEVLSNRPGSKVVIEVKCSQALFDAVKEMGGEPIWGRPGHSLIKAKMREVGAPLAGEMSGHLFFGDEYFGYDDACYAAARLLRILSYSDESLSELLAAFPQPFNTPEVRPFCSDETKFAVVKKSQELLGQRYENITIDGIRFWTDENTWGLIRASNTQPALIVRSESDKEDKLEQVKQLISETLKEAGNVEFDWGKQGE